MRRELSCSLTFVLYEYFCWLRSQKRNCWLSICTHWIGKPAAKLLSKQAETIYIPSNNDENVQATFKDPFPRSHKPLNAFRGREEWSTFTPAPPPLHTWNSRRQITSFSKSRGRGRPNIPTHSPPLPTQPNNFWPDFFFFSLGGGGELPLGFKPLTLNPRIFWSGLPLPLHFWLSHFYLCRSNANISTSTCHILSMWYSNKYSLRNYLSSKAHQLKGNCKHRDPETVKGNTQAKEPMAEMENGWVFYICPQRTLFIFIYLFFVAAPMARRSSWVRDRTQAIAMTMHPQPTGHQGTPKVLFLEKKDSL